jgi:uncharacterized protein YdhG (YjbR/CyaY superfamily)
MKTDRHAPSIIEEYIEGYPPEVQVILNKVRATIRKAAPNAKETISYQIPAFSLEGNLVYFAAFSKHIGFFPTASGIANFQDELSSFKTSKGTAQFPLDKPIPYALIGKITRFRVKENLARAKAKSKKKQRDAPK